MIAVDQLCVRVGTFQLGGISFEIPAGQYAVLMGRTGSGKTTLLEAICGLREVTAGTICLAGVDVTRKKPAERGIGYVPQDGALFPTMNVGDQLAFGLVLRKWNLRQIEARVHELAAWLNIEHILHRTPEGLSGGEKQRVALGRALASGPSILLMDEPLSALDQETREEMRTLLKAVQRYAGVTTLHVTHSRNEAELLADHIIEIKDRRLVHHIEQTAARGDRSVGQPSDVDGVPRPTAGQRTPR